MKRQPTYIKDTTDFIRKLEEIKVPNEALLVILDIVSMYTNTPHDEATAAVGKALQQETSCNDSKIKTPPTECMLDMLKIIVQNNTFEFNDETNLWVQHGVARLPRNSRHHFSRNRN